MFEKICIGLVSLFAAISVAFIGWLVIVFGSLLFAPVHEKDVYIANKQEVYYEEENTPVIIYVNNTPITTYIYTPAHYDYHISFDTLPSYMTLEKSSWDTLSVKQHVHVTYKIAIDGTYVYRSVQGID